MNLAEEKADANVRADVVQELLRKSILSELRACSDAVEALDQWYNEQCAKGEQGLETLEKLRRVAFRLLEIKKKEAKEDLEAGQRLVRLLNIGRGLFSLVQRIQTLRSENLKSMSQGEQDAGTSVAEGIGSSAANEEENRVQESPAVKMNMDLWELLAPRPPPSETDEDLAKLANLELASDDEDFGQEMEWLDD